MFIFEFFLDPFFVYCYCFIIASLFIWWLFPFLRKAKRLEIKLSDATEKLSVIESEKGFVQQFEQYHEYAGIQFGRAWEEFVEMLIFPSPGSDNLIRNTSEVSKYLNEATIITPTVSFRFLHSVPNLLMGLGILGTFVGLSAGVGTANSGLSSGIPSEITASLGQLLSGASLAFFSSIVGIILSIVFLGIERNRSRKLQSGLRKWVDELEKRLLLVTAPSIALKQLEQAELATQQLVSFNTDLVFSIEKALEDKIAGRIAPQLERVVESIEGLRSDRTTDAGYMIERSLSQFTAAMQERTGTQFEEMATVVASLNTTLKNASNDLARTQIDLRETMDSVVTNVKTSLDESTTSIPKILHKSLGGVSDFVSDASKKMTDYWLQSSNAAAEELHSIITSLTSDLATTSVNAVAQISDSLRGLEKAAEVLGQSTEQSRNVLASMTSFVGQLNSLRDIITSSHRQMTTLAGQLTGAAQDVQISSDRSAETLEKTTSAIERMGSMIQTLEENQQSTTIAWTQYQERFEEIDGSLANVFEQIDEGLTRYCAQVGQFATNLDKTTANAIKNLAAAIGEFNESIEELIPRLPSIDQS